MQKSFPYHKKCHWEGMVNFSSFDLIRHNIVANGYFQVTIQQRQELGNYLQVEMRN